MQEGITRVRIIAKCTEEGLIGTFIENVYSVYRIKFDNTICKCFFYEDFEILKEQSNVNSNLQSNDEENNEQACNC